MIQMIIADDEPVITKGLRNLIGWKELGIHIVGSYENGRDALHGIIAHKADIALLDISMPEMTGIEVLKELERLNTGVKVIFISGFHDFEYARSALKYGARGYLLKPVIKEELIGRIEKCIEELGINSTSPLKAHPAEEPYDRLITLEEADYTLVLINVQYHGKTDQERKLIEFSVISLVEKYLDEKQCGVLFRKPTGSFIVFRENEIEVVQAYIKEINYRLRNEIDYGIQGIIGMAVSTLGEIPQSYQTCLKRERYFFFMAAWEKETIRADGPIIRRRATKKELMDALGDLIDFMIRQEYDQVLRQYKWYGDLIALISDGSKEDACYYFCLGISEIGKQLNQRGIYHEDADTSELLKEGRETSDFLEMLEAYRRHMLFCYQSVQSSIERNISRDIRYAKNYINQHYKENLSLKILADVMCMNSYYFSSFFKKNSGMNFKDYLNEIRLEHAVPLLITTDQRINEIVTEVGFSDERSFAKAFRKKYGEAPTAYKKKILSPDQRKETTEETN